jgi:hypothetical protein
VGATPLSRLSALAEHAGIDVVTMDAEGVGGLAGAIAIGLDEHGQPRTTIGVAEDLDDDLRTDVLAFCVAVVVGDTQRITSSASGCLDIRRERLEPVRQGPGHLAKHMLYTCGRDTPSATFDLVTRNSVVRYP